MVPPGGSKEAVVTAMLEDERLCEVHLEDVRTRTTLKNIYIGKVQKVVQNINAAFIEFEKGSVGYFPLEELADAIFTKKQGKKPLVPGDELLVQVAKEAHKTKAAVLTTNLSLTGKYFVITMGKKGIGMSGKLEEAVKISCKELVLSNRTTDYGIIVRTNAAHADEDTLIQELHSLEQQVQTMIEEAKYRTPFSLIKSAPMEYQTVLTGAYRAQKDEIITDDAELYAELVQYMKETSREDAERLRFYEDCLLPLHKLYNLERQLEQACRTHVWLKSGAYIIIEQTEAFHVIDVNTGKFDKNRNKKDTFLKINKEAAAECARQMRLRNLSGIVLIDFINMQDRADREQLLDEFAQMTGRDRVKTTVVDMTPLGIVEVTRKKERRSLQETLQQFV